MITVTFHCDGCTATAEGKTWLGREFISVSGRDHGFGSYKYDTALDVVPNGWLYPCPAGATYCPTCAAAFREETP